MTMFLGDPLDQLQNRGQGAYHPGLSSIGTTTFAPPQENLDVPHVSLISAMAAKGHGIEAICLFLALARDVLLSLIVNHDLAMPHCRPLRRAGGVKAWTEPQYRILLAGWLGNWQTQVLADQLGRSRGSIWAKARRMGLPRRQRARLFRPSDNQLSLYQLPPAIRLPEPTRPGLPGQKQWTVMLAGEPATFVRKRVGGNGRRAEIDLVKSQGAAVVAQMFWAGVRTPIISEKTGISVRALTTRKSMIGVPKLTTGYTGSFDPAIAQANIARLGYVERKVQHCLEDRYWAPRGVYWSRRSEIYRSKHSTMYAD